MLDGSDSNRPTGARVTLGRLGVGFVLGALIGFIVKDLNLPALLSYWRPRSPLVPTLAVAFALLYLLPIRKLLVAAVAILSGLWVAAAFTPLAARLIPHVLRADPIADADAIFVFSSSMQPDGNPSPVDMERLHHGFELFSAHRAPHLIVSELPRPLNHQEELARAWLPYFNVTGDVVAVGPVRTTRDEAVAVARLCRERGWKRVIAVSSPTHLRRAAATLEHEGLEVIASPSVETRFNLERLVTSDDRILAFTAALHDILGYFIYRLRGWV